MGDFKDLKVYQKAFSLAMAIFDISKNFPVEEKYALITQIRNSSRSVCSNIAEAYRKRQYPAHFCSKISDADMENSETQVWLNFSLACSYIPNQIFMDFMDRSLEIGRMLSHIIHNPTKFKTA
jgi:four helix bundle protein